MRYLLPSLFALACMSSAQAMDTTTQSLVISGYVTSQVTAAPFDR
ncbi:Holliday junction resolvase, partial [Pseudomonas mosselii]|nr:Holliday junction resolvase [Pseudomonas mosselii]